MIFEETYTLAGGITIPKLALGTWLMDNAQTAQAVKTALSIGYRHIDTAQAYGNEQGVGEGVRLSGVAREKIFVTSKVAAEHKQALLFYVISSCMSLTSIIPFHLWVKYLPGIDFKRTNQGIQYLHFRISFAVLDVEDGALVDIDFFS